MSVKGEAKLILKGVAKGLTSIIIPPKKEAPQSEFLTLHWCPQCQAYHKKR